MAFVHRKLWGFKPNQYGPYKIVHGSLLDNLEKIYGIDSTKCILAVPLWEKATLSAHDYSILPITGSLASTVSWTDIGVKGGGASGSKILFGDYDKLEPDYISIFSVFKHDGVDTGYICGKVQSAFNYTLFVDNGGQKVNFDVAGSVAAASIGGFGGDLDFIDNTIATATAVYDGANATIDVRSSKGKKFASGAKTGTIAKNNDPFAILDRGANSQPYAAQVGGLFLFDGAITKNQENQLHDNKYGMWQPVPQTTYFLPQEVGVLPINFISQGQSIDNIDIVQHNVLSINPINQPQSIGNITLITSIKLIIDKMIQNQSPDNINLIQHNILSVDDSEQPQSIENLDLIVSGTLATDPINQSQSIENIPLLQHNIIAIDKLEQIQEMDNIDLIIAGVLSIAPIIMAQDIDNIIVIQHNNLAIDGIDQLQELEQITLDTGILLQIAGMVQNQSIDSLVLTQAHKLEIDKLLQGQAIDNIILSVVGDKIVITLSLKTYGIDLSAKANGIDLSIN